MCSFRELQTCQSYCLSYYEDNPKDLGNKCMFCTHPFVYTGSLWNYHRMHITCLYFDNSCIISCTFMSLVNEMNGAWKRIILVIRKIAGSCCLWILFTQLLIFVGYIKLLVKLKAVATFINKLFQITRCCKTDRKKVWTACKTNLICERPVKAKHAAGWTFCVKASVLHFGWRGGT